MPEKDVYAFLFRVPRQSKKSVEISPDESADSTDEHHYNVQLVHMQVI